VAALPVASLSPVQSDVGPVASGALAPTLSVVARDAKGNPVANAPVAWSVDSSNGWIFPLSSVTDGTGTASAAWVLGSSGSPTATATTNTPGGQVAARITATSTAPTLPLANNASDIVFMSPAAQGYRVDISPQTDPSGTYYAAMNWDAGYAGIQRGGDLFDRQIHFSAWDRPNVTTIVIDSAGSTCARFGGEGTGVKCRFSYPWTVDGTYRFEMQSAPTPGAAAGTSSDITVWFTDLATNTRIKGATFRQGGVPNLTYVVAFDEDFVRTSTSCLAVPLRQVIVQNVAWFDGTNWTRLTQGSYTPVDPFTPTHCANAGYRVVSNGVLLTVGGTVVVNPKQPGQFVIP
jgi:Domain of unknown function (DUF3472)/Bacterial Ig-like domain (group 1)